MTSCGVSYMGQTRRNVEICFREHLKDPELPGRKGPSTFRSKVTENVVLNKRRFSRETVRLVNYINDMRKRDVAESIKIYKPERMNFSTGIKAAVTPGS